MDFRYIGRLPTKKELLVQRLASVNIGDCLDYGPYVTENLGRRDSYHNSSVPFQG